MLLPTLPGARSIGVGGTSPLFWRLWPLVCENNLLAWRPDPDPETWAGRPSPMKAFCRLAFTWRGALLGWGWHITEEICRLTLGLFIGDPMGVDNG